MTRAYNTATTQQNSGGAVNPFVAGKNKIINGDFSVWQRGTSFTPSSNVDNIYTADRFVDFFIGTGTTTISQQTFTPGTAPVAGYEGTYFKRAALSSGSTYYAMQQKIEDVRTLAGQTVTISFWAKATSSIGFLIYWRQNFGTGGSALADTTAAMTVSSSSWTRYSVTIASPSVAGKTIGTSSHVQVLLAQSGGTVASNTVDFWGFQVEAGPVATPFQTATGTIQGELAACQRYYWRTTTTSTGLIFATGISEDATRNWTPVYNPVEMRIPPTSVDFSALNVSDAVSFTSAVSGVNISVAGTNINRCSFVTTGQTAKQSVHILSQSGGGYLGFSAEL
jgi:hypothetical protein